MRASIAASVATFLALMSHVAGGGALPGWVGIAVPWVLSLLVCTFLMGRRLSTVRLAIAVALSQLLFHILFVLGMYAPSAAGHQHGAAVVMATTGDDVVAMIHSTPTMWMWHGFAAVITTIALHRAERSFSQLRGLAAEIVAWVRRVIDVASEPALAPTSAPSRLSGTAHVVPPRIHLASVRRRGPPLARVI